MSTLDAFTAAIPTELHDLSGAAPYSGRAAFEHPQVPVYLLGLNPGGDPADSREQTLAASLERTWGREMFSSYVDGIWAGKTVPGVHRTQRRIQHLAKNLGLDLRRVPSSNLIFVRSKREATLADKARAEDLSWPFHRAVIDELGIRTIIAMHGDTGEAVLRRLGGFRQIDEDYEKNGRGWAFRAYEDRRGRRVIQIPHPGIAAWNIQATDPSEFVLRNLAEIRVAP